MLTNQLMFTVLRHGAENLSGFQVLAVAALAIDILAGGFGIATFCVRYFMNLPNSRTQEMEGTPKTFLKLVFMLKGDQSADRLGMQLSANACYDPKASPECV